MIEDVLVTIGAIFIIILWLAATITFIIDVLEENNE